MERLAPLTRLRELDLSLTAVTGNRFYELQGLRDLTRLTLSQSRINAEGLKQLKVLPSLKELYLTDTDVDNAGAAYVTPLANLEDLRLDGTKIQRQGGLDVTPDGFSLPRFDRLMSLSVTRTRVDDEFIGVLENLPALQGLAIDHTRITPVGVARIVELGRAGFLKHLTHLSVSPEQVANGTKEALEQTFPDLKISIVADR
jgi:Leucine-rich repeat (LRR) protein